MGDRLLVYGGRNFDDEAAVFAALDDWQRDRGVDVLINGACGVDGGDVAGFTMDEARAWIVKHAKGADGHAHRWAVGRGVSGLAFPAFWWRDGRAAGPLRNRLMLEKGQPTAALEFPGGRGTANMRGLLVGAGVPVWVWSEGVVRPLGGADA